METDIGRRWRLLVIKIVRGDRHICVPDAHIVLEEGDILEISGDYKDIDNFCGIGIERRLLTPADKPVKSLDEFLIEESGLEDEKRLVCAYIALKTHSRIVNKSVLKARVRQYWPCFLLAVERGFYPMVNPRSSTIFRRDDVVWTIGCIKDVPLDRFELYEPAMIKEKEKAEADAQLWAQIVSQAETE